MPANLVPAIGSIVAVVLAGIALYYWRRSSSLYALLVEGANRFEELRQRNGQLEQTLLKAEERIKQGREQSGRLEKAVDEAREKSAELVKKLEQKDHEIRLVTDKLELQKGHLEKQLAKAQNHLTQHESYRQELEAQAAALRNDSETVRREAQAQLREVDSHNRELQLKIKELEKERGNLEKKSKEADPMELRRMKRKIAQYDRLYAGMKGLREMSEERNRNWETALRKLSEWVLRESGTFQGKDRFPTTIGPLVGHALQAIGAQLIDDTEVNGAGRAHSMDAHSDESPTAAALADAADREAEAFALKHGLGARSSDAETE